MSSQRSHKTVRCTNGSTANHRQGRAHNLTLPIVGSAVLLIIIAAAIAWPRLTSKAKEAVQSVAPTNGPSERVAAVDPTAGPTRASATAQDDEQIQPITPQDGLIKIAASDLADGRARFYVVRGMSKPIPFFLVKSSDGIVRAAFDACDVCFAARKGYHQEGDEMVCNNCGTRFPLARINEVRGGCNPGPLERQVQGDTIVIKASDIEAGARYF